MRKLPGRLRRDSDSIHMREAIDKLETLCVTLHRPSAYQLKMGCLNYFPDTGTLHFDAKPALPDRGLEACIKLIRAGRASR